MIEKIDGYKQSIWEKQNPLRHLNRDGMEQNFKFLKGSQGHSPAYLECCAYDLEEEGYILFSEELKKLAAKKRRLWLKWNQYPFYRLQNPVRMVLLQVDADKRLSEKIHALMKSKKKSKRMGLIKRLIRKETAYCNRLEKGCIHT